MLNAKRSVAAGKTILGSLVVDDRQFSLISCVKTYIGV